MSIWPLIGVSMAAAIAPAIRSFLTSPIRRLIRHRMNDGPLRRILLTPLGYNKKARNNAAMQAIRDDYHLLIPDSHQLRKRNSTSKRGDSSSRL